MLFNSLGFLVFFPIVCIIYFIIPSLKWRNLFLLAASYYFYMSWEPVYALLLLTSTLLTYLSALGITHFQEKRTKKLCLTSSIVLNLLILFLFKYYDFAAENIASLMTTAGVRLSVPEFRVLLPVGISFYTFQALGYSIDVYRGDTKVERNFFTYALFVSFFPQLVAGPIERSTNLLKQFYERHKFDGDMCIEGVKLMLWGYFMKLCIAENVAPYVNAVFNNLPQHNGTSVLMASFFFTFQLYCDFCGYSLIAIGTARCMGYRLMDNFRRPYVLSTSMQDFWKRNHISLTTWFMDYVYYPMTEYKNNINWWCFCIFATFLISGLWHGAAWTFVVWGGLHGILLVIEMRTNKAKKKIEKKLHLKGNQLYIWLQRLWTFVLCWFTCIFFRSNTLSDALLAIKKIFTNPGLMYNGEGKPAIALPIVLIALMLCKEMKEEYNWRSLSLMHNKRNWVANVSTAGLIIVILLCARFEGGQFIYFQF